MSLRAERSNLVYNNCIDDKGKRTGVILPIKRYEKLLEDLHDMAIVAERREEGPISLEDMKRRLKKNGLL